MTTTPATTGTFTHYANVARPAVVTPPPAPVQYAVATPVPPPRPAPVPNAVMTAPSFVTNPTPAEIAASQAAQAPVAKPDAGTVVAIIVGVAGLGAVIYFALRKS